MAVLRRPPSLLRPGRLLVRTLADWEAAFTKWSVLLLWFSVFLVAHPWPTKVPLARRMQPWTLICSWSSPTSMRTWAGSLA